MIFRRSLVRELTATTIGLFLVLLAILFTQSVIRILGRAAGGAIAADGVLALIGFNAMFYLNLLLSVALFLTVLLTLSRWYRDSEMVVWFTSGQGIYRLVNPILTFALPLIIAIGFLSVFVTPWATQKGMDFREQMDSRDELKAIAPGVFKESQHADRVFFIERFSTRTHDVHNIFAQSMQHGKLGIIVASEGKQSQDAKGDTFVTLQSGRRYEGKPDSPEFNVMSFERYALRTEPAEAKREPPSSKSTSSLQLLRERSPDNVAELQWRLSLPISAFLLALLAIPLSFVDPRAGRSANLILAILVYLFYNNMLSILQSWVARDKLSPLIGLWPAHIAVLLLFFYLFYRRVFLLPLLPRWLGMFAR